MLEKELKKLRVKGECVNYFGMKKGVEVSRGVWCDTIEVEPSNFKHVFRSVSVNM